MLLPIPLKPAAAAGFRGIGSWILEAATCTLLIRYIRENFKIATFSCLSRMYEKSTQSIYFKNYRDCRYTCNPRDNYMHFTGYPLRHGVSLHFLWGKNLQCIFVIKKPGELELELSTKLSITNCVQ